MVKAYYKTILLPLMILMCLISFEISLDTLRYIKNSGGHIALAKQEKKVKENESKKIELVQKKSAFPFHSPPISMSDYQKMDYRIWFASASHAADKHGIQNQFPNQLCQSANLSNCKVLNASRIGYDLSQNIDFYKTYCDLWKPEYVIIYQMSIEIQKLSQIENCKHNNAKVQHNFTYEDRQTSSSLLKEILGVERYFEGLSIHIYPRELIGSNFLLHTPLKPQLSTFSRNKFSNRLLMFINEIRAHGSKPVLMTFVSAYNENSESEIYWRMKTWSLLWDETLSPTGFINTIADYNDLIRKLAKDNNIALIDAASAWKDVEKKPFFDDFVHLNVLGHKKMASLISYDFQKVLTR